MKCLRITPNEARRLWDAHQLEHDLHGTRINPRLPASMAWEGQLLLNDKGLRGTFSHSTVTADEPDNLYELFYEEIENGA